MLDDELLVAIDLARRAGELTLEHYNSEIIAEEKLGVDQMYEPVTEADRAASRLIVEGLSERFPNDAILSEEEPDDVEARLSRERCWIIDPIDGTAGFVRRDGDFSVQIGLARNGEPIVGVVFEPFHDVLLAAVLDGGSFIETRGERRECRVSPRDELSDLRLAMSRNHPTKRMNRVIEHFAFRSIVRRGSVGLKVGLLATDESDIYIHPSPRTKIWDTCAPQIILTESGGRMTDLFGDPLRYDIAELQNHNGIIASNGISHDAVVAEMSTLLAEFGRVPYAVAG